MAFMMVLLVFLLAVAVWAYFHTNPPVAARRPLASYNGVVMLVAIVAGIAIGRWLYLDAVVVKGSHAGMPVYLSVMAGSTAFLIVLALGGMVRNFFVFASAPRVGTARN